MIIQNSTSTDIDAIFDLYKIATDYQLQKKSVSWPAFNRQMVENEIATQHQWKMLEDNTIACVWATTFSDPLIWQEKNKDPAVYIHRIATHPSFRGRQLVNSIIDWAKAFAVSNNKFYLRLDTVGENQGLIKHYCNCGFNFLGLSKPEDTAGLPRHYHNASVSLFEMPLQQYN